MIKNKKLPVVFYFPYRDASGVPILFLRVAEALKDHYDVYLGDYSNGFMALNMPKGIKLISIDEKPEFPLQGIFVFQSFLPWRFPFLSQIGTGSKLLYWNLHPENFDPRIFNYHHQSLLISRISKLANVVGLSRRHKLQKILNYLQNRKAIVYMDKENVSSTERFLKIKINSPQFIPVPVPPPSECKNPPQRLYTPINFAWIGRICDFKYRILEHTIVRLSNATEKIGPSRLIIIGEGEFRKYIEQVAATHRKINFDINFTGEIAVNKLPKYLIENVDILFSMGTSALEAARVGIPVYLTNYSYKKIVHNYRFRLLFENTEYCLGHEITSDDYENESSLENSIDEVIADYSKYAIKSYKYWESNFSLGYVKEKLMYAIESTEATFGEMADLGYFNPDFFGHVLRSLSVRLRKDLSMESVGFRYDC